MAAEELLARLKRRLGIEDDSADELLTDELQDAKAELLLYLNRKSLPAHMARYVVQIAALLYQRDRQAMDGDGAKSWSYSEGEQSQSMTLQTGEDYQRAIDGILSGLARYRVVSVRGLDPDEAS